MTCNLSSLAIQTQMQNLLAAVDRKSGILIGAHKDQRDNNTWAILYELTACEARYVSALYWVDNDLIADSNKHTTYRVAFAYFSTYARDV